MKNKYFLYLFSILVICALSLAGYQHFVSNYEVNKKEDVLGRANDESKTKITITSTPTLTPQPSKSNNKNTPTPITTTSPTPEISNNNTLTVVQETQNLDDGKKSSIENIFKQIGNINVDLARAINFNGILEQDAQRLLQECEGQYEDIFDPFARQNLYQQCRETANIPLSHKIETSGMYSQIKSLSQQAYNTALSCSNSTDCLNNIYWSWVNAFESKGLIAR